MDRQHCGFTLVELVSVIVLLGILGAVAAPRFMDLSSSAHRSTVDNVSTAFAAAAQQARIAWSVRGYTGPGVNDNVIGFGSGNVDVNMAGWPVDTSNANVVGGQARCVRLWNGILSSAPSISRLNQPALDTDYKASSSSGLQRCIYTYQRDSVVRRFTYHANTGAITMNNP